MRDPNQFDTQNVSLGDLWLNETNQNVWVLVSLAGDMMSKGSLATWTKIDNAGGTGILDTLTGDTGGAIDPDINSNINLVSGIVGFTFDGNPGTNTITLNSTGGSGDVVQTIVTDDGTAAPVLGVINLIADTVAQNAGSSVAFFGATDTVLFNVTDTNDNTIIGNGSGNATISGQSNTVLGFDCAVSLTSGNGNVMLGNRVGKSLLTGSTNVLIGSLTGQSYTGSESSNILIGTNVVGVIAETNTLRIGAGTGVGGGQLHQAFISGIDGVNVGSTATVVTEANNQLGTAVITAGGGIAVTAGANTITISATGIIAVPSFFVYMFDTVTNVTGSGEVYTILYDTIVDNIGGNYNIGTGIFTAPTTGVYNFSVGILCECGTYQVQQPVYANLVTSTRTFAMIVGVGFLTGSTLQRARYGQFNSNFYTFMVAGDTAFVTVTNNTGGTNINLDGIAGSADSPVTGIVNFFSGSLI
jgi:hypothetical protein